MQKYARNTRVGQKVAVQLVGGPNHIRGQNGNYKKLVWNERIKEGSKNVLHLMGLLLTWFLKTIQWKGLIEPAKQGYYAVQSICTFDWPRVGTSQKMIPRDVACPTSPGRALKKRLLCSLGFIKQVVPCRKKWLMNNTNSLVWYKFLGDLRPEEKRMQLARVFFFLERNRISFIAKSLAAG